MSSSIKLDEKTAIERVVGWVLLVKLDPVEKESPGGIAFGQEKIFKDELGQTRATVMSISASAWNDETDREGNVIPRCAVGDRILFRQLAGEMLDVQGADKYRIINDKDVYAVLTNA